MRHSVLFLALFLYNFQNLAYIGKMVVVDAKTGDYAVDKSGIT
jgi:hypothetical protein